MWAYEGSRQLLLQLTADAACVRVDSHRHELRSTQEVANVIRRHRRTSSTRAVAAMVLALAGSAAGASTAAATPLAVPPQVAEVKHQSEGVTPSNQPTASTIDDPASSSDARVDHCRAQLTSGRELGEVAGQADKPTRVELPLNRGEAAIESLVVFHDSGAEESRFDATSQWHLEPGSSPIERVNGKLVKAGTDQFHRMTSTGRFGGPGKTLKISYRARATAIRDRDGSSIVEGAKVGLKWPGSSSVTGYAKDDPRSVHGSPTQADPAGPGSYAFLTGLTEDGYLELSRNGYGSEEYEFFPNKHADYKPGTWKDVVVTVEWLG